MHLTTSPAEKNAVPVGRSIRWHRVLAAFGKKLTWGVAQQAASACQAGGSRSMGEFGESRPARGTGPTRCYIVPSATSRRLRSAGLLIRAITAAGRSIDIVAQPKERRYARAASHNVMSVRITRMTPVARRTVRIENRFSTPRPPTAARAATVQSARMAPTATLNAEP